MPNEMIFGIALAIIAFVLFSPIGPNDYFDYFEEKRRRKKSDSKVKLKKQAAYREKIKRNREEAALKASQDKEQRNKR